LGYEFKQVFIGAIVLYLYILYL